jgi:hypothetical protein
MSEVPQLADRLLKTVSNVGDKILDGPARVGGKPLDHPKLHRCSHQMLLRTVM